MVMVSLLPLLCCFIMVIMMCVMIVRMVAVIMLPHYDYNQISYAYHYNHYHGH